MGLIKFHYIGSPDGLNYTQKIEANPYISDEAAYQETVDAINATEGKTQMCKNHMFIQLSTMQKKVCHINYTITTDYSNLFEDNSIWYFIRSIKGLVSQKAIEIK